MELRKIQVTGGSTHVVSLPKKWVDRNHLGRSDTVAIHEEPDGSLLVVPHGEARVPKRTIAVNLSEAQGEAEVVRRLVGAYIAGADEIAVAGGNRMDAKVRNKAREVARALVGVEIVEETQGGMVLQDLVGVSDLDLRKTLTRMHRIARLMHDDALQAIERLDPGLATDVQSRDDEVDRLLWMVSKQMHALLEQPRLAAKLDVSPAGALNYFLVARSLERMADHAAKICNNVALLQGRDVPKDVLGQVAAQGDVVRKIWDDAFAALKKPDFPAASRVADRGEEAAAWRASFSALLKRQPAEAVAPLTLVADSIDRIRGYAVDICETAMNHTFVHAAASR